MLRLTELKLPLDHDEAALPALIVKTLGITSAELASHHIHKRSYDARKKKPAAGLHCARHAEQPAAGGALDRAV